MTRRCLVFALPLSAMMWTAIAAVVLGGCAVGRGPAGEIIIGPKLGQLVETASEAANAAAGFLPPPWNFIVTGAVSLLAGGGIAGARSRLAGERAGWEEAAATFQPPPPVPAPAPVRPVDPAGGAGAAS